jgi:hypothetical protein
MHRAIGQRTDLGVYLSGDIGIRSSVDESDLVSYDGSPLTSDHDSDDFDVDLWFGAELRRWHPVSHKVSWFHGCLLGTEFTYSFSEDESAVSELTRTRTFDTSLDGYAIGLSAALSIGVELELMQHLSFAIMAVPLQLSHRWREAQRDSRDTSSLEDRPRTDTDTDSYSRFAVDVDSSVRTSLSIWF